MNAQTTAVAERMESRPIFLGVREVKAQIAALLHSHPDISADAQLLADSLEGETNLQEVLERLLDLESAASFTADAIRARENSLAERRERFERQKEAYRAMMLQLMEAAGQNKAILPVATISVVKGRPDCVITDGTKLSDEYVEIVRKPVKALITAALKAGSRVEGAELKNGAPHISIRT